jgi:peptide chain release factor 1
MREKLDGIEARFADVERELSVPDVFKDRERYERISREHAELGKIVTVYREYRKTETELENSLELLKDEDRRHQGNGQRRNRSAIRRTGKPAED